MGPRTIVNEHMLFSVRLGTIILFGAGLGLKAQTTDTHRLQGISDFARSVFYFEENRGQANGEVLYVGHGMRHRIAVTRSGAMLASDSQIVSMQLVGFRSNAHFDAEGPVEGVSNYYLGSDSITGLQHYARVRGQNVYPGITIVYYSTDSELEYDLVLDPGADSSAVRFRFESSDRPEVTSTGDLLLRTKLGDLLQRRPKAWQTIAGENRQVECSYNLRSNGEVGLILGKYDHSAKLTIDPVLSFSTYLGGNNND